MAITCKNALLAHDLCARLHDRTLGSSGILFCDAQPVTMQYTAHGGSSKSGLWITGALRKIRGWIFPKKRYVRIFIWRRWIFYIRVPHARVKYVAVWFSALLYGRLYTFRRADILVYIQDVRKCIFCRTLKYINMYFSVIFFAILAWNILQQGWKAKQNIGFANKLRDKISETQKDNVICIFFWFSNFWIMRMWYVYFTLFCYNFITYGPCVLHK